MDLLLCIIKLFRFEWSDKISNEWPDVNMLLKL